MRGPALLALSGALFACGGCATSQLQERSLTVHGELALRAQQSAGIALVRDRQEFSAAGPPSQRQMVREVINEFPMGDPL